MEDYSHGLNLPFAKNIEPNTFRTSTTKGLINYMRQKPMTKQTFISQINWALEFIPHRPNNPQLYNALIGLVVGYGLTVG
ncbi:hypothetical protein HMPREF9104_03268 [Lentilactobacillus kisonensis F0435]|uniref:Uncharacterized protein n=1 Tax=Lentilactobacillus kisonensis F0435 TaxID=797516 RepID=H1LKW3_9LACO|nr:hypothetical protein HMPREF9104_03268 [Lentilactobacillus kisonensis F0435]